MSSFTAENEDRLFGRASWSPSTALRLISPGSSFCDFDVYAAPNFIQMYRVDGKLIAMGVLDILPSCVSSVYFVYDKTWGKYSLGKVRKDFGFLQSY
jgi:arginyl-tRNA--protein-N-Asp/Glu arginylyltransferase